MAEYTIAAILFCRWRMFGDIIASSMMGTAMANLAESCRIIYNYLMPVTCRAMTSFTCNSWLTKGSINAW